jgi:hypothetical protein
MRPKLSYRPTRWNAGPHLKSSSGAGRPGAALHADGMRDQVGDPQGLGPVATSRDPVQQQDRLRRATPDGGGPDRPTSGRDLEQRMASNPSPPDRGVAREVGPERGVDPLELGSGAGHGDHRPSQHPSDAVEIDDVEPSERDPVQQDGSDPFELPHGTDEIDEALARVPTVDLDRTDRDALDLVGGRPDDRDDRRPTPTPRERSVVDGDDPRVFLGEGPPQG